MPPSVFAERGGVGPDAVELIRFKFRKRRGVERGNVWLCVLGVAILYALFYLIPTVVKQRLLLCFINEATEAWRG